MKYITERQKERERAVPALILAYCRDVIVEQQPRDSTDSRVKQHERKMCSFLLFPFAVILILQIESVMSIRQSGWKAKH